MNNDFPHVFPYHYEKSALVTAMPARVFAYADDQKRLSSHMNQSSWKMGGGRMLIELVPRRLELVNAKSRKLHCDRLSPAA